MVSNSALLEKALEAAGGKEEFGRKFQQYDESLSFFDTNRQKLLKKYDGRWVDVYNSKVVAVGKEYKQIIDKVHRLKLPQEEIATKFISSRKVMTLF